MMICQFLREAEAAYFGLMVDGLGSGSMQISTEREFQENAAGILRASSPILVTRRGRLSGIFFPRPESTLPVELKRELFAGLSADVAQQISKRGISEEEIIADFQSWRKKRREDRRGH
ncbi:MAG: hypothetical protein ABR907_00960 [Terracidiphilus sp.]|jgi:hypothetical protein